MDSHSEWITDFALEICNLPRIIEFALRLHINSQSLSQSESSNFSQCVIKMVKDQVQYKSQISFNFRRTVYKINPQENFYFTFQHRCNSSSEIWALPLCKRQQVFYQLRNATGCCGGNTSLVSICHKRNFKWWRTKVQLWCRGPMVAWTGKIYLKVVVRAEILPRDFLQTPGNYCLWRIKSKIQV